MTGHGRPTLHLADARLEALFYHDTWRYATVGDYARALGRDVLAVLDALGGCFADGTLGVEAVGDELFVHTAPAGRPAPDGVVQVVPNLWETLRNGRSAEEAHRTWGAVRDIAAAGWDVEVRPDYVPGHRSTLPHPPFCAVRLANGTLVPVVYGAAAERLAGPSGVLAAWAATPLPAVLLTCPAGGLDHYVTEVRRFLRTSPASMDLAVMVCEAPRYEPVLLTRDDVAIDGRTVVLDPEDHEAHGARTVDRH